MKIEIKGESKVEHPLLAKNVALLIEYKYADEMDEEGWRNSYVVVADPDTELGKEVNRYLDLDETETDFVRLDKVLTEAFGITDEDCVFYLNHGLHDNTYEEVEKELKDSNDMIVNEFVETIKEKEKQ